MTILSKLTYRFNAISIKSQHVYLQKINKLILKFLWKLKGLRIAKTTLRKKKKIRKLTLLGVKTHCKVTVIRIVYCHRADLRSVEQNWESRNNWPVDFQQGCQYNSVRKKIVVSTDGAGTTGYPRAKELHHIQKFNSKWIKDLNVSTETIKHLEETHSLL